MKTKTPGNIVASNLHAAQIISGRDVERVAKQIDAEGLATAQHAFAEWLRELEGEIRKGNTDTAIHMNSIGLAAGV